MLRAAQEVGPIEVAYFEKRMTTLIKRKRARTIELRFVSLYAQYDDRLVYHNE